MSTAFVKYTTPDRATHFSEEFFASLSFRETIELSLLTILHSNALDSWSWIEGVNVSPFQKVLTAAEYVPTRDDLADILNGMYDAFQEGIRGVSLTLSTPLGKKTITGHLSLIRLYVAVINHTSHVHLARAAFSRLNKAALISQEHIDAFGKECILVTSPAFSTAASMPLWEFGTLTGENWLCDDILNSYGELAYFRHLAINPLREVQYLQLTTHFFQEAEPLYNQTPHLYSPNLIDIRSRLCSSRFRGFRIKLWDENHWSSYFYNWSNVLEHRDSLDRPPMPKVLDILNWVIDGIGIPSVEHFLTVSGPLQPSGSGSCGIIAHNFIENRMDPACALWTPVHPQQECDKWLRAPDLKHNPPNAPIPETSFPYLDYNTCDIQPPLELKKKDFTPVGRLAAIDTFNSSLCSQNADSSSDIWVLSDSEDESFTADTDSSLPEPRELWPHNSTLHTQIKDKSPLTDLHMDKDLTPASPWGGSIKTPILKKSQAHVMVVHCHLKPLLLELYTRVLKKPKSSCARMRRNEAASFKWHRTRNGLMLLVDAHLVQLPKPNANCQITNAINNACARAWADVEQLGGNFASIINNLQQKVANGEVWTYSLKLDDNGKVVGLWWQSPEQAALSCPYSDILINDNAANRNQYGYPLNIGIVIDNFGNSQNVWYALQACEDANMHTWVLRNHLDATGKHPDVFVSDRDPALILRESWAQFKQEFWTVYRSISPEVFDTCWKALEQAYPAAKTYLNELFTSYELFNLLNQRTQTQTEKEMTRVHEATRRHHDDNLKVLFMKPLALLCAHVEPFALQTSYREMKLSIYYRAEALQLPDGHRNWSEYAIQAEEVTGFEWKDGEEKHMCNAFCNDDTLILTVFLLLLITGQGFRIQHLLRIIHLGTSTAHTLAILDSGSYFSNPLEHCRAGPTLSPATQTVNSRTIIHEANAAVKSLAHGIQTQEQLDQLMTQLNAIGYSHATRSQGLNPEPSIHDPPVPQHKGRPRTARLTSAIEGPQHGGENLVTNSPPHLRRRQNHCGLCGEAGHDRRHCYDVHQERQEDQERQCQEDRNAARGR
ncbi:hypothetical protein K439DRAFT_1533343 [Ramaria rubella]|nr:hypothetical protein K439DRAFT_1533343 [Ramaria rubella]